MTRKYNHEVKILREYDPNELEKKFKEYTDSVQERYGDSFNLSHWVELFDDGSGFPMIHMFIFMEEYMSDEEYNKKYPDEGSRIVYKSTENK